MLARFERLMQQAVEGSLRRVFPTTLPAGATRQGRGAGDGGDAGRRRARPRRCRTYRLRLAPLISSASPTTRPRCRVELSRYLADVRPRARPAADRASRGSSWSRTRASALAASGPRRASSISRRPKKRRSRPPLKARADCAWRTWRGRAAAAAPARDATLWLVHRLGCAVRARAAGGASCASGAASTTTWSSAISAFRAITPSCAGSSRAGWCTTSRAPTARSSTTSASPAQPRELQCCASAT